MRCWLDLVDDQSLFTKIRNNCRQRAVHLALLEANDREVVDVGGAAETLLRPQHWREVPVADLKAGTQAASLDSTCSDTLCYQKAPTPPHRKNPEAGEDLIRGGQRGAIEFPKPTGGG